MTEVAAAPQVIDADNAAPTSFGSPSRPKSTPVPASNNTTAATSNTASATAADMTQRSTPSKGSSARAPIAVTGSPAAESPAPRGPSPNGSPNSKRGEKVPKIVVKKEPSSPGPPSTTRRRPARLHLEESNTDSAVTRGPRTAAPNLATMRDAGMACLSPGFATQDPTMREQLQRSASVREQQRSIIEARLQRQPKTAGGQKEGESSSRAGSAKRRPPNSLSIIPPPHRAFANERVIQSAPLNQSFTGRNQPPPHQHHHAGSHLQHSTTHSQQMNRLPPISDVLNASSEHHPPRPLDSSRPTYSSGYNAPPAQPSPSNVAYQRPREHRSAEEALQHMSGGREDRLPRIVHYGGHQPPTPPSPPMHPGQTPHKLPPQRGYEPPLSAGIRRSFAEYDRDNDGPGSRDSPETKRQKKEEFLALCARAWELFHS